jgi:hypothetical protein
MIVVRDESQDGPEIDFVDQEVLQFIVEDMLQKREGVNEDLNLMEIKTSTH